MADTNGDLKISASELGNFVGAKSRDIDNWLQRPELFEKFKATRHGARRSMSRDNVLQLAFIATFMKFGAKISAAINLSVKILRLESDHQLKEWLVVVPDQDPVEFDQFDEMPSGYAIKARANIATPPIAMIVAAGETVRRVDELFNHKFIRRKLSAAED